MDHPGFTVSNLMEYSMGLKRVHLSPQALKVMSIVHLLLDQIPTNWKTNNLEQVLLPQEQFDHDQIFMKITVKTKFNGI